MRISASEQSLVTVGQRPDEAKACIDQAQATDLVELGDRIRARVASWHSPTRLRLEQYVGVVRVGELQLEILPKLDGLPDPAQVRRNLLAMLAVTQDLEVRPSEVVGFLESGEPFLCALARLYCRRLLEFVRRGLRQEYVLHSELLPHIRGKIDWSAQARLAATQRLEFPCVYDERSEDTPLNRTLKAALVEAGSILEGSGLSSEITELRHAMDAIADTCPGGDELQRLRTDRINRSLEPVLVLAKLILGNRSPDLGRDARGNRSTYALVWDMNVLFEEYVGRLARQTLGAQGLRVDLQQAGASYLAVESRAQQNAFLLRPDILVRRGRDALVVADTKWKRLEPRQPNLGVSAPDVYQVLAYARRYQVDRAVLIYPHHPALGPPGPQRNFVTQGDAAMRVSIGIVTVNLSLLESIPNQLRLGLLGPVEEGPA